MPPTVPPTVEQQLDLPVYEPVGDEKVEFPRLDLDDLIRWASEVKQVRIREAQKRLAAKVQKGDLSAADQDRREQELVDDDIQIGWLMNKAYTPEGIRKVLELSLRKTGRKDEERLAIVRKIHFVRQSAMARELMSPPPPPEKKDKGKPEDKTGSDFTSPETGDSSNPSVT